MSDHQASAIVASYQALARPSGAFAMVAIDQRESLRAMLAAGDSSHVADAELIGFKRDVARALSGQASALLVDRPLGLSAIASIGPLPASCGLIVAADVLDQEPGRPIRRVTVDDEAADAAVAVGANALKLLVPWRSNESATVRGDLVSQFTQVCRSVGLLALVEAVVSDDGEHSTEWCGTDGILAAAAEMTTHEFDVYKAQVPTFGLGDPTEIRDLAIHLTAIIGRPWVVLSNGVPSERFEVGVAAACRGGASGFLAGRAIWASALNAGDRGKHLAEASAGRLGRLVEVVDATARPWTAAITNPE